MKKTTNKLRTVRLAIGLAQIELAARSGVGLTTVNRLENWPFIPAVDTANKLAKVLGVPVVDLFPTVSRHRKPEVQA